MALKILDNAVITKCGECKHKTNNLSVGNITLCSKPPFIKDENKFYRTVNPDTIDKNCRLQDVEVIKTNDYEFVELAIEAVNDLLLEGEHKGRNDIDKIIIVKKGE